MIVTVHQIEHAPHLSLFKKFEKADIIVLGDTFQFKKNYFENRNKIRANNISGWQWITVPVEKENHKPIKDVQIIYKNNWQKKYLGALKQNYSSSPHFNIIYPIIEDIIMEREGQIIYISDLNERLLIFIMDCLNIIKPIIKTSELKEENLKGTDLLVNICKQLNANTYLSGSSGKDYLELNKFGDIKVMFHEKEEGLSAFDYLFYNGVK
jgi:hypothetical protein